MSKLRFLPTALLMTSAGLTLACGDSRTFGSPPVADASGGAGGQGGSIGPGGGQSDGSGGSLAESGSDADRQTSLNELVFEEQFTPAPDAVEDSAVGQCGNPGRLAANFDAWTANVRINTDSRPGGCQQSFAIKDPAHALASATLKITFEPDGDPAQCGQPGDHVVPITATGAEWSAYYTIDTDDRSGGCTMSSWTSISSPTRMRRMPALPSVEIRASIRSRREIRSPSVSIRTVYQADASKDSACEAEPPMAAES